MKVGNRSAACGDLHLQESKSTFAWEDTYIYIIGVAPTKPSNEDGEQLCSMWGSAFAGKQVYICMGGHIIGGALIKPSNEDGEQLCSCGDLHLQGSKSTFAWEDMYIDAWRGIHDASALGILFSLNDVGVFSRPAKTHDMHSQQASARLRMCTHTHTRTFTHTYTHTPVFLFPKGPFRPPNLHAASHTEAPGFNGEVDFMLM
eukprot:1142671-Pelagomonas_calceolata.AAC.4